MPKFSANLGFLWTELTLPDAIRAAHRAGFDAVECHWPYDTDPAAIDAALEETGLTMLGLNTSRGATGENGLSALPLRETDARAAIDEAITYALRIGTPNIHVMAGFAKGPQAEATFKANLQYACMQAAPHGMTILIEPLNRYDAPGYFLSTSEQGRQVLAGVGGTGAKLMFDCYHMQLMEGNLTHRLKDILPIIGHVQFASVPDRGTPDHGEVNYAHIFAQLDALGWDMPLGAEYKPIAPTVETLGWMELYSSKSSE